MVAFVDIIIIIIIDNNQYSLPIQYIESDMMLLPLTLFKFFISWDIPTAITNYHYITYKSSIKKMIRVLKSIMGVVLTRGWNKLTN